jgi:hypothetical protein
MFKKLLEGTKDAVRWIKDNPKEMRLLTEDAVIKGVTIGLAICAVYVMAGGEIKTFDELLMIKKD